MKNSFTILALFLSYLLGAQCPEGDITFNTQTDVDAFLDSFPDCTEISGNLTIDLDDDENQSLNLTGLNQLESIDGVLTILKIHYFDSVLDSIIPGSLEGLDGLQNVSKIQIGEGSGEPTYHIHSLEPLSGIGGHIQFLRLNRLVL